MTYGPRWVARVCPRFLDIDTMDDDDLAALPESKGNMIRRALRLCCRFIASGSGERARSEGKRG
jgi:hypothetical protein